MKLPLKYHEAPDVKMLADEIIERLDFFHVAPQAVYCYRSVGSKSRRIIARIHGFGKIWQQALGLPPSYVIEVLSERYDKLSQEDKEKTVLHELMHIPHGFKGGFRPHKGYVSRQQVEKMYKEYKKRKQATTQN
ncbi:MAG: metallopeptidase [Candidatus Bathyarchaeum sp.]|nr:MAG: metallopeptidase [Candidatus Bathyarchaeum sp.]